MNCNLVFGGGAAPRIRASASWTNPLPRIRKHSPGHRAGISTEKETAIMLKTTAVKAGDVKRGDSVLANFRWRKVSTVWIKGDLACITFGRSGSVELPADRMLNVRQATYA